MLRYRSLEGFMQASVMMIAGPKLGLGKRMGKGAAKADHFAASTEPIFLR
jgi:hypothetical protein